MTSLASSIYCLRRDSPTNGFRYDYRLIQYYITKDGPQSGHFSADLKTCASELGERYPMIAVSFPYFCWIDKIYEPGIWPPRLELKIARFPPPYELHWNVEDHVRKVDIPSDVLTSAERIFLAPTKASILILTWSRKLHTFRFA